MSLSHRGRRPGGHGHPSTHGCAGDLAILVQELEPGGTEREQSVQWFCPRAERGRAGEHAGLELTFALVLAIARTVALGDAGA